MRLIATRCCSTRCQDLMSPLRVGVWWLVVAGCGACGSSLLVASSTTEAAVAVGSVGLSGSVSAGILLWVNACVCTSDDGSSSLSGRGAGAGVEVAGVCRHPMVRPSCNAAASGVAAACCGSGCVGGAFCEAVPCWSPRNGRLSTNAACVCVCWACGRLCFCGRCGWLR